MNEIKMTVPKGTTKKRKIVGRGTGSGHGGTACKGNKGQNARAGGGVRLGFEGGQMPLYRRIARRGFSNSRFKTEYSILNLVDLQSIEAGTTITKTLLLDKGIIRKKQLPVKLLGNGEVNKNFTIDLDKVSKAAQEKIEQAGGTIVLKTKSEVDENGK